MRRPPVSQLPGHPGREPRRNAPPACSSSAIRSDPRGSRDLGPAQVQAYAGSSTAEPALAEVERGEGVDHDRRLVEVVDAERRLDRGGLRAVGVAAGVQRDRADVDAEPLRAS